MPKKAYIKCSYTDEHIIKNLGGMKRKRHFNQCTFKVYSFSHKSTHFMPITVTSVETVASIIVTVNMKRYFVRLRYSGHYLHYNKTHGMPLTAQQKEQSREIKVPPSW